MFLYYFVFLKIEYEQFPDDIYECLLRFLSCIKPKDYERSKQRKWKTDIRKARNLEYLSKKDAFLCAKGRKLRFSHRRKSKSKTGFTWGSKVYESKITGYIPRYSAKKKLRKLRKQSMSMGLFLLQPLLFYPKG